MKASNSGMNPEHEQLAQKECEEVVRQGLIESTDSEWVCKTFYINKQVEQTRSYQLPAFESISP